MLLAMRDQSEIQAKIQNEMQVEGIGALILTRPESIFYATGYASQFLYAMQQAGIAYAVVPNNGQCKLVVSNFEKQTAELQCSNVVIDQYDSWVFVDDGTDDVMQEKTTDFSGNQSFSIVEKFISDIGSKIKIGIEASSLNYQMTEMFNQAFGRENLVDCASLINKACSIKTDWEIEMLRESAQITEKAMALTAKELKPGMTEFDVKALYRKNVDAVNKNTIDITVVISIGANYSPAYIPRDYILEEGDIIRLDGGVNYYGYRSDIARTFVLGGKPSIAQKEKFDALLAGYRKGLSMIKPGVEFSKVFNAVQKTIREAGIANYVRGHVGHSISVAIGVEEAPYIAAAQEGVFEKGMVLCFECPYYSTTGGYNIEDTLLITDDGIELFTHANETLIWPV